MGFTKYKKRGFVNQLLSIDEWEKLFWCDIPVVLGDLFAAGTIDVQAESGVGREDVSERESATAQIDFVKEGLSS